MSTSSLDARFVTSKTAKFAVIDEARAADTAPPAPGPPGPAPPAPGPPGHLFILLADIKRLACDAWIGVGAGGMLDPARCVPSPHGRGASGPWLRRASRQRHPDIWRLEPSDGGAWPSGEPRLYVLRDTHSIIMRAESALRRSACDDDDAAAAALARTGAAFVDVAADDLLESAVPPLYGRARHLIALPLIGTGAGGARMSSGAVARAMVARLAERASARGIDVALLTIDAATHAAAQAARAADGLAGDWAHALAGRAVLDRAASELAEITTRGDLALFVGAGASVGAGLPVWSQLVRALARRARMTAPAELEELARLDVLDQAQVLERRINARAARARARRAMTAASAAATTPRTRRGGVSFSIGADESEGTSDGGDDDDASSGSDVETDTDAGDDDDERGSAFTRAVAREVSTRRYSAAHAMLAALPVHMYITTNYDKCLETALRVATMNTTYSRVNRSADDIAVLPHAPRASARRVVVKLHGDVDRPGSIVLTREDYMRYASSAAGTTLAGVVQASLAQKHMLFVGFGLADPNFAAIIDSVRRALPRGATAAPRPRRASTRAKSPPPPPRRAAAPASGVTAVRAPRARSARPRRGTAIALAHEPLKQELWADDLWFVTMQPPPSPPPPNAPPDAATDAPPRVPFGELVRLHDIFLDCIAARCACAARTEHLLDARFADALSAGERAVADALKALVEHAPPEAVAIPAWSVIEDAARRLGAHEIDLLRARERAEKSAPAQPV